MDIRTLQNEAWANSEKHGFHETEKDREPITKLMLMIEEIIESFQEIRDGNNLRLITYREEDGKPEGFPVELADLVIRTCDLAGILQVDLMRAIAEKHAFNLTRPYKHGRKL